MAYTSTIGRRRREERRRKEIDNILASYSLILYYTLIPLPVHSLPTIPWSQTQSLTFIIYWVFCLVCRYGRWQRALLLPLHSIPFCTHLYCASCSYNLFPLYLHTPVTKESKQILATIIYIWYQLNEIITLFYMIHWIQKWKYSAYLYSIRLQYSEVGGGTNDLWMHRK